MWAEKVGGVCTVGEAALLHNKFLCRDHFLLTDFMNSATLQWLEIKWHYFQLTSVLFRFELQQVISAIVYV